MSTSSRPMDWEDGESSPEILSCSSSSDKRDGLLIDDMAVSRVEFRSFRISEITPGKPWPKHLRELIKSPTGGVDQSERRIVVGEVVALLCHAALVEVGFVPHKPALSVEEICTVSNMERLERLGRTVNPDGYNSAAAVFAWNYCVLRATGNVRDCAVPKEKKDDLTSKNRGEGIKNLEDECTEVWESRCSPTYEFSSPCSVILIPRGAKVQVFCNFLGSEDQKPFQVNIDIDIRNFVENPAPNLSDLKLNAEEWMETLQLRGMKFYSCFKTKFGALCLDAMNGIMLDQRGLVCLPPEILVHIFAHSDIRSIRNLRLTCKYLNDVADIPGLWRRLIKRDFGSTPTVFMPAPRFTRFCNRVPYELSSNILSAQQDYRTIYEAQRRSSRTSTDIRGMGGGNRLGSRHTWLPYVTLPRPYFFRISRDVLPMTGVLSKLDMYHPHFCTN